MKLGDLFKDVIKYGLKADPRTPGQIKKDLERVKKDYKSLTAVEKRFYDKELLEHPYSDTRLLYGKPDTDVRTVMVGIDMEGPELLLADRLRDKGVNIDLVIAHHPEGKAIASLTGVMHLQKDILSGFGLKPEIAAQLLDERIGEVSRGISSANHARAVDIARLLDIPFMCMHTPADNHVSGYLTGLFKSRNCRTVNDVLTVLRAIPEYQAGMAIGAGPVLTAGKGASNAGKIFVDMTGGTEGAKNIYARLSQAGVGTIVAMHLSEGHFKNAKSEHMNVIVAGHIASDNLGMNLLLDKIESKEKLKVVPCSGFQRVRR